MRKRRAVFLAVFSALLLSVWSLSVSAQSARTTADLNLRTGPGMEYSVIDVIGEGSGVEIEETSGEWCKVRLSSGKSGYMHSDYLSSVGASGGGEGGPAETVSESYRTTADVNLRTGRSTGTSVITTVDEGTVLTVTDKSGGTWYGVRLSDGRTGYMHSDYLSAAGTSEGGNDSPAETVSESYRTTADVNLRAGRSTGTSVITTVDEGTMLTVTDKSDGTWYGVRLSDGRTGYMHSDYLSAAGTSEGGNDSPAETVSESYRTTADVNLRTGRGTGTSVITTVDEGTMLTVTDKSGGTWYGVRLSDGRTGYMHSDYLSSVGASGGGEPAPPEGGLAEPHFTTADVRLRAGRGTGYDTIAVIGEGDTVTVLDKSNADWYQVKLSDGRVGYVYAEYLAAVSGTHIAGVPYLNQLGSYPNGCESVSAVMALRYAGVDVSVNRFIDSYLPMGDTPYWGSGGMTGSNPWKAFLGSPYSEDGWGCYAPPIASAMRSIAPGLTVDEMYGASLDSLCHSYIDQNIPVLVWATIDMSTPGSGTSWTAYDGTEVTWVYPMHTLVLIGYDDSYYYFNDPMNSANTRYAKAAVERAYRAEHSQAVAVY